jgi:hypothetical protein
MAVYGYRATDGSGRIAEGAIDATGERAVLDRLRGMNLVPIRVWPAAVATGKVGEEPFWGKPRAARKDLLPFLQGFKTLLSAGIPMDRALEMLAGLFRESAMGGVSAFLLREVRGGSSLHDAMRKAPGAPFSGFLIQMVEAGQSTGRWKRRLEQALPIHDRARDFRSKPSGPLFLCDPWPQSLLSLLMSVRSCAFCGSVSPLRGDSSFPLADPHPSLAASTFLRDYALLLAGGAWGPTSFPWATSLRKRAGCGTRESSLGPRLGYTDRAGKSRDPAFAFVRFWAGGVTILSAFVIAREDSGNSAIREGLRLNAKDP